MEQSITNQERIRAQLGFGSAPVGGLYAPLAEADAIKTITFAYEQGIRFFDTAPKYGNGLSETRLGLALRSYPRDSYRLSTKVGWDISAGDGQPTPAFSRDGVRRSIEGSLHRLQTDYLDVVHIHDPDEHFNIARAETYPALLELKAEGVIGAIGAGMNQWQMLAQFLDADAFDAFLLAGRYTLLEQEAHNFLLRSMAAQTRIYLGGVFNSGILATGAVDGARYNYTQAPPDIMQRVRRIEAICQQQHVLLTSAALQFCLAHPAVDLLIVGARTPQEISANITALEQVIPAVFWQQMQQENLLSPGVPVPNC